MFGGLRELQIKDITFITHHEVQFFFYTIAYCLFSIP